MTSEKTKFLFKFYYIGSKKFYGSQRQLNFPTIESYLINALLKKKYITGIEEADFEVASMTDKYVSARGAAFSVKTNKKPILMEINAELPLEIGLWAYTRVPLNFSSRFDALYRYYKYILLIERGNPHNDNSLNIDLIKRACKKLEGQHDFKNFSKKENDKTNTIRTLDLASVNLKEDYLIFCFKSKAFLRQQIRRMVKKLIEVGVGKLDYAEFLKLFNTANYISYQPANPTGLILWDIIYDNDVRFIIDAKSSKRMMSYFEQRERKSNLKKILFQILQHDNIS
jgi:tRNA pseudouridine(38-40) synthase